jgi:hypothetical protein
MEDFGTHFTQVRIGKFRDPDGMVEALSKAGMPISGLIEFLPDRFIVLEEWEGNVLCNLGIQVLWYNTTTAGGGTDTTAGLFSNAHAVIYTGTGAPGVAAANTYANLTAGVALSMDSTYPKFINGIYTQVAFHGTAGSGVANQAWAQYAVANADATPVLLNYLEAAKGTKVSGETWTIEIDITIS